MNRVLKYIERIMQVLTIISAIWTTIEVINMKLYKRKLKEKADEYLDEEFALESDIRGNIIVQSPSLEVKQQRVYKLVGITIVGALMSCILNIINRDK